MAATIRPVALIVAAGVVVSMHVGKLPPALPLLREEFGMTLVQASFLVSLFQLAGAMFGVFGGMVADRLGPRRVMLGGLVIAAAGSAAGALAGDAATLLASRAIESAGFILAVLPGPALLARTVDVSRLRLVMGCWSAYMPAGMGLGLALSPIGQAWFGWRPVWWAIAVLSLAVAWAIAAIVPPDRRDFAVAHDVPGDRADPVAARLAAPRPQAAWLALVRDTLAAPRSWLLALTFGCYSSQWIAVFGFLPTFYREGGVSLEVAGALTAVGALSNVTGNVASGALLQRGLSRTTLIAAGSASMLAGAWLCFGTDLPLAVRFAGVLLFSSMAGLIPGTLFATTPFYAPHAGAVSTTTGLMQQGSALGQVASPPVVAAVAVASAGWHNTWLVTGTMSVVVFGLAFVFAALDRHGSSGVVGAGR
jgi:MFS transporter, CP family, cyanate transporter